MFADVRKLGGDGTVLYASWLFQRIVPPVLSFALGSLGFLTKFDYDSFPDTLTTAFNNGITVTLRLRFEATIMRAVQRDDGQQRDLVRELIGEESEDARTHKPERSHDILNDLVLDRGPSPSKPLITFPFLFSLWVHFLPPRCSTSRHLFSLSSNHSPFQLLLTISPLT